MRCKKYRFSLIEVMIAFFLLSILLTTLMSSFRDQIFFFRDNDQKEMSTMYRVMLHDKLSKIFLEIPSGDNGLHTSEANSLHFTMNNGPHKNPELAGHVHASLHIKDNNFCFTIKSKTSAAEETSILMEAVKYLTFSFLKEDKTLTATWEQVENKIPLGLSITMNEEKKSTLYFILSQKLPVYIYDKDGHIL